MSDLFTALDALVRVVDGGSFSAAARVLSTSQATISRQIGLLENHFGTRLFHRSTRRLTLTDDGRDLLVHARRIADEVTAAELAIGRQRMAPHGRVHVATPTAFGMYLTQRLTLLHERYPEISLSLTLQDNMPDLFEHGLDLAVRVGEAHEAPVISRHIGDVERVIVGTQSYFRDKPLPKTPEDLQNLNCIEYLYGTVQPGWDFVGEHEGKSTRPSISGWLSVNSSIGVRQAVFSGLGIAILPMFMVAPDIADGSLIRILPDHPLVPAPVHLAYPSRHNLPPKTRAVIDFLAEQFLVAVRPEA